MKLRLLILGSALHLAAGTALAQSNVSIYGVLNTGVTYISNEAGKSSVRESDGGMQGMRMGFRGSEDLGSGYKAVFTLETGFNLDTGELGQGGRLFGRQALVGISAPWGTVTLGRQYDHMFDLRGYSGLSYVHSYAARPWSAAALVGSNGSSNDFDRLVGTRVDNSVKFTSPKFDGFSFGAMYGLGEVAGDNRSGSTISANARYAAGPVDVGLAYTSRRDAALPSDYQTWGLGGSYKLNADTALTALYTNSNWTLTGDKVDVFEVGAKHMLTPRLQLAASYDYIKPNHGNTNVIFKGTHHQLNGSLDYFLTKRTDVYLALAYQKAESGYAARIAQMGATDAATPRQSLAEVGIRHKF